MQKQNVQQQVKLVTVKISKDKGSIIKYTSRVDFVKKQERQHQQVLNSNNANIRPLYILSFSS